MIDKVSIQVCKLLDQDHSGHGVEHINRVLDLSLKFAQIEHANQEVVSLITLLHDVDDYKLFGKENAELLINAKSILVQCSIAKPIQEQVLKAIQTIGYNKRLSGIYPLTLEAKIVSDADMCDAMGATGILRSYQYNLSHGHLFFDRNIYPALNMSADDYRAKKDGTVVTHMFEKLFKLKDLMLTDSGRKEAIKRHEIMVQFLYHFFEEQNALEWIDYLNQILNNQDVNDI